MSNSAPREATSTNLAKIRAARVFPNRLCASLRCQTVLLPTARGRRRVVINRFHGLQLPAAESLQLILHALLEGLDALDNITHQVRNLATNQTSTQDDCDHDDQVPKV